MTPFAELGGEVVNPGQRRPVFWFLWPKINGPVDSEYRQVRLLRIPARGPWRLVMLIGATWGLVIGSAALLLAASTAPLPLLFAIGATLATAVLALLRGWVVGTYVNDEGYAIRRISCTNSGRWEAGNRVSIIGSTAFIIRRDGSLVATHISSRSLDLWLRPVAFGASVDLLERWACHKP